MEAMRHTSHGATTRVQQELDASRAQLEDAARASRARELEADEWRRLLAEAERLQQQTQARLQELRTQLDVSQTRRAAAEGVGNREGDEVSRGACARLDQCRLHLTCVPGVHGAVSCLDAVDERRAAVAVSEGRAHHAQRRRQVRCAVF